MKVAVVGEGVDAGAVVTADVDVEADAVYPTVLVLRPPPRRFRAKAPQAGGLRWGEMSLSTEISTF